MSTPADHAVAPRTRLPDFCGLPVLFAMLVLAAIVVVVALLAPGSSLNLNEFALATLFAVWLALLTGGCLCALRRGLQRLPPLAAYAAVWLLIVLVVALASAVVAWLDQRLGTRMTSVGLTRFVAGNGAVAALIGAALLRYFYVLAQYQERLQAAARAQVEALQARIRPHFLFNSMNTVAALVRVDADAAEATIENLSELFRAALGADDQPGTLGEELELVERYLAIEQLRLGERLQVELDTAEAPAALRLPRLLLQPLVENAVHHGIHGYREGGLVRLAVRRTAGEVRVVIDNPLPTGADRSGHGHAQDNVRRRIGYHFGTRGALETDVRGDRYRVVVRLPDDDAAHAPGAPA
ncbi:MAG TPA: histidine kinase [Rhodanobacteraceae bacterium]|nr:histidine kinase [Rhodanobacteraceae bacterium]